MHFTPVPGVPHEKASLNLTWVILHLLRLSFLRDLSHSWGGSWSWLGGTAACDDGFSFMSLCLHLCIAPHLSWNARPNPRSYLYWVICQHWIICQSLDAFPHSDITLQGKHANMFFPAFRTHGNIENPTPYKTRLSELLHFLLPSFWFLQLCNYFANFKILAKFSPRSGGRGTFLLTSWIAAFQQVKLREAQLFNVLPQAASLAPGGPSGPITPL